ncbi:MAG: SDR family oxidoreductase, partial [Holophaga sp.]|nr:SDR family oxidoreductase [Holophaga sp.]
MTHSDRSWVLITGCSTGIGRALVASCREAGWGVVATARSARALEALAPGPDLRCLELDVTGPASIAAAAEACGGLRLTALVNNAGYGQMGPLEWIGTEQLRAQLETNVLGLHAVTRAFLPLIRSNARPGEGRIVQVASVFGRMSVPMAGAYCASKHAVVALAEALRLEEPGIRVILVEPGAIRSEFRGTLVKALGDLPAQVRGTRFEPALAAYLARHEAHAESHGLSAEACARRITAAMARTRPPRRVVIGADAFWGNLAKAVLPAALWEWG